MNDRTDDRKIEFYDGHVRTSLDPSVEDALSNPTGSAPLAVVDESEIVSSGDTDMSVDDDAPGSSDRPDDESRAVNAEELGAPETANDADLAPDVANIENPEYAASEPPVDFEREDMLLDELDPLAVDDGHFCGSPSALGDAIPDGHGGNTPVTDIAVVRDARGSDVGWAYRGGDGGDYFEPRPGAGRAAAVGVAMEVTAWHGGTGDHSGVRALQTGDIRGGDTVQGMNGAGTWLDLTKLGYTPSQTMTLAEGAQATGKILAVTDSDVIQNAGRGVVYVHPRDAFYDAVPEPGSQATIANQNGRFAALADLERPPERELGIERGGRGT